MASTRNIDRIILDLEGNLEGALEGKLERNLKVN